jgi:hypothetical protein
VPTAQPDHSNPGPIPTLDQPVQKVGVGLTFARTVEQGARHWFVHFVVPNSPAAMSGQVQPGDKFLRCCLSSKFHCPRSSKFPAAHK